jgi:hypothetical protein
MNKKGWANLFFLAVMIFGGCTTMVKPVAPPPSESTGEYRELQGDLQRQQADIAIISRKIEDQSRDLVENLTRLEDSIAGAAPDAGETERQSWLAQVQAARTAAEDHQVEVENLNRQLAAERETSIKKDEKFNEYESVMTGRLADRDTENAGLRENVKAVKGQRNTLLAIVITAVSVVILSVTVKVLRVLKMIPF